MLIYQTIAPGNNTSGGNDLELTIAKNVGDLIGPVTVIASTNVSFPVNTDVSSYFFGPADNRSGQTSPFIWQVGGVNLSNTTLQYILYHP